MLSSLFVRFVFAFAFAKFERAGNRGLHDTINTRSFCA